MISDAEVGGHRTKPRPAASVSRRSGREMVNARKSAMSVPTTSDPKATLMSELRTW
jgi:hypothetical protein